MFGLITLLLTAGSAISQYEAQSEQAAYQKKQQQIQKNINALKERRAKIQSLKEMKAAQAEATQSGVQSGANFQSSSGYQGGMASIGSQFSSNAAYTSTLNNLQTELGGDKSKIYAAQSRAAVFGAGASLFGQNFGGYSEMNSMASNIFK